MKVLILYDYPPPPAGLATQGDLLYQGLREIGIEIYAAHFEIAGSNRISLLALVIGDTPLS
jgi:alpha-maltose-1-phosphate synthase